MGTGLTFDEYVELRLRALAGADRAFVRAAEMELDELFPVNTDYEVLYSPADTLVSRATGRPKGDGTVGAMATPARSRWGCAGARP